MPVRQESRKHVVYHVLMCGYCDREYTLHHNYGTLDRLREHAALDRWKYAVDPDSKSGKKVDLCPQHVGVAILGGTA